MKRPQTYKSSFWLTALFALAVAVSTHAEIHSVKVSSAVMNRDIPATITVPKDYQSTDAPRPVLYLLHGAGDNERGWCDRTPVQEMSDIYGVIIVTPSVGLSWYFDSPVDKDSQFETFVSSELVKFVDTHYRTLAKREGRALAGNSMGGHGAMFLAVRHKDVFSAVAPMSGGMDIRASDPQVGAFPENWGIKRYLGTIQEHPKRWDELTVINGVDGLKNGELAISIDCGDKDFFLVVNRQLDAKLTARGIAHEYAEHPGQHNWSYWKVALPRQMAFLDEHFKRALAPSRVNLEGGTLASVTNEMVVKDGDPRVVKLGQPNLHLLRCGKPSPRGTVLLFPGGAYRLLSVTKEGSSVARVLNEARYDVAILEYSIAVPDVRDKALAEAVRAVRMLRERGNDLQLQTATLGVMGFSAGGHLAARTMHALGSKEAPDFGILIYPAYLDRGQELQPDVTPPAGSKTSIFALITDNDNPGWVTGTKAFVEACRTNGQRQELHLLHGGGHGFGITTDLQPPLDRWPELLRAFVNGSPMSAPQAGNADFPAPSPSARHEQKEKEIKSDRHDQMMLGDSTNQTAGAAESSNPAPTLSVTNSLPAVLLPYLQNPTHEGMTICFLARNAEEVRVAWAMGQTAFPEVPASATAIDGTPWTIWKTRLTHLKPGALYAYQVHYQLAGMSNSTATFHFRTLNPRSKTLRAVAFNDLHNDDKTLEALMRHVQPDDFEFSILMGDCWTDPSPANGADKVFRTWNAYLQLLDAANKPVVFVRGNHETRGKFSGRMACLFDLPNLDASKKPDDAQWQFTLRAGPLFFLAMDTGEDDGFDTPEDSYKRPKFWQAYRQREAQWLKELLATNPGKDAAFRVFLSHIPLYNTSPHFSDPACQYWGPLLSTAGIDLMMAGHTHKWDLLPKGQSCELRSRKNGVEESRAVILPSPVLIGGGPALNQATVTLLSADEHILHARMLAAKDGRVLAEFTGKADGK